MDKKSIYTNTIRKIPDPEGNIAFKTLGRLNICLIECRIMEEIKYVLNAVLQIYHPSEIGLTIVCGNLNAVYISNCFKKWKNLKIINIGVDNLNRSTYSALLKMPSFWERFTKWSHVLIYQTDALIMRKIDDLYFDYDYIGAPWKNLDNWLGNNKPKYNGGNGGFSLRRVSSMLSICEMHRGIPIEQIDGSNEDAFFCSFNLKYPSGDDHKKFSVEEIFHPFPIGGHQLYRYLSDEEFIHMINHIESQFKLQEMNNVLVFTLFGGINGVGFYNQIFSLELAIYMSNFFKRKLYLRIEQPIANMGLCDWSLGTIFDYIFDIDNLLPYGYEIFKKGEFDDTKFVIHDIIMNNYISSCYYVDKEFRDENYEKDIEDFAHGRQDISTNLDILFDVNKQYVSFKYSNASRFFYNFYTNRENYILMSKIAKSISKTNDFIDNIFSSLKLPDKYIAIHFRFGDIDKDTSYINREKSIIYENLVPWLEENNANNLSLIIMCDRESHEIIKFLKSKYNVTLTSSMVSSSIFESIYKNPSLAKFLVEKKICENSNIFLGTRTSTVSVHINYMNYLNYKPYKHYINYCNSNFRKSKLEYKEVCFDKKWSWARYNYDKGHPIAWTVFFDDNIYR